MTDPEVTQALGIARSLAAAGIPVFVAYPDPEGKTESGRQTGFMLPKGWQNTTPNPAYAGAWQPGRALCAVMGHGLDLVDIDPRNGGDLAALNERMPVVYGQAASPSGGTHLFVRSMGVGSRDGVLPGIDVKAGTPGNSDHGYAFIAPTVRRSKVTGKPAAYRWVKAPDLSRLGREDTSGKHLAELVRQARGPRQRTASSAGFTQPSTWWDNNTGPIPQGERHAKLVSYAGKLRDTGLPLAEAEVLMLHRWQDCDQPPAAEFPVTKQEALAKLHDVYSRYPPGDDLTAEASSAQPGGTGSSWEPVDLTAALTGGEVDKDPVLLTREDGVRLLYAGKLHTISGESESLKTWLALLACAATINGGRHVLFIDYEDCADGIAGRMLALGCGHDSIGRYFHYVRPAEPYTAAAAAVLDGALPAPPALVTIDGVTEAMAAHGLDPMSNSEVAAFNARLPKPFAARGAIVAMIDHVTKSREGRGRYAIGAQHKLSAVDGAAYTVELLAPFGHGMHGKAKISVAKDRPGRVRKHTPGGVAGILHLESQLDGSVMAAIRAPAETSRTEAGSFRPTILMERVSRVIEDQPGLTSRAVVAAATGKTEHKRLALELLITEDYVTVERDGNVHRHKSARPFRNTSAGVPGEPL